MAVRVATVEMAIPKNANFLRLSVSAAMVLGSSDDILFP